MFRDGLEGFGAVKMLAAGDEPDFGLFKIYHDKTWLMLSKRCWFSVVKKFCRALS
jgi:hypothetical protein